MYVFGGTGNQHQIMESGHPLPSPKKPVFQKTFLTSVLRSETSFGRSFPTDRNHTMKHFFPTFLKSHPTQFRRASPTFHQFRFAGGAFSHQKTNRLSVNHKSVQWPRKSAFHVIFPAFPFALPQWWEPPVVFPLGFSQGFQQCGDPWENDADLWRSRQLPGERIQRSHGRCQMAKCDCAGHGWNMMEHMKMDEGWKSQLYWGRFFCFVLDLSAEVLG